MKRIQWKNDDTLNIVKEKEEWFLRIECIR